MGKDKITSHDRAELFDHLVNTKPRDPTSNIRVARPKATSEKVREAKAANVLGLLSGKTLTAAAGGTFITEVVDGESDEDQELLERDTMKKVILFPTFISSLFLHTYVLIMLGCRCHRCL